MRNKVLEGLKSYINGRKAERQAARYLQRKGYRLIERNVRGVRGMGAGELDLIMLQKDTLVFIEVKRRAHQQDCAYAITSLAQQRLFRGAEVFLASHPAYRQYNCRFDAILIGDDLHTIEHIPDAWRG